MTEVYGDYTLSLMIAGDYASGDAGRYAIYINPFFIFE
jgi:hypothetical protein